MSDDGKFVYAIDIDANELPVFMREEDITGFLHDGTMEIMQYDPFICLTPENEVSMKDRALRDILWENLKELLEFEPEIFNGEIRSRLVASG